MDSVETWVNDIRQAAQGVIKQVPRQHIIDCDKDGSFPHQLYDTMSELGLWGVGLPEEHGGMGGGVSAMVALVETLSAAGMPPFNFLITGFARMAIYTHGTPEQVEKFVKPTADGSKRIAFAITEPNAGTNTMAIKTFAKKNGDNYIINGQKAFISGVNDCEWMLLITRTQLLKDVPNPAVGITPFIVDTKSPGIELNEMRIRVSPPDRQYEVFLDDVAVPVERMVGKEGDGMKGLFVGLNPERLMTSAISCGLADYAINKAVEYIKERAPFGKPTGSYQGLQHPLARAKARLEAARLMLYDAARRIDLGEKTGAVPSMAKLLCSEVASEAFDIAIQCHGGYGFDEDYDLITLLPCARAQRVAPVNNEMMLNFIGEHVLGLPKSY